VRFRPSCRNNSIIFGRCMKIFQTIFDIVIIIWNKKPISVAARSKSWVHARLLVGIAGSNPAMRHGCLFVVTVVCCQVEVFATS
jgi:hypothetical protein